MKDDKLVKKMLTLLQNAKERESNLKDLTVELAALMLEAATLEKTFAENLQQQELARMMTDEQGKYFLTAMTDQCFRSKNSWRVASQIRMLIKKFGIPNYFSWVKKMALSGYRLLGELFSPGLVPSTKYFLRKETSNLILPGERDALIAHMEKRRKQGVRINLNHLGEAILGEREAEHRFNIYLEDLENPHVEYISVKISTIYSQINLPAWEETLEALAIRFRKLLEVAASHTFTLATGRKIPKFVNLDMEEYRDLGITVALFKKVLNEERFLKTSAGIVLQAYLPDSFNVQRELTEWAIERVKKGGAPIKIRIVKGANLAMEQVEASLRGWPQAPFENKSEVDANFKQMINYGMKKEHAEAVHIGVGSHNLFDIAYAILLSNKEGVEDKIALEMLEGMADPLRRVVQQLTPETLLYCPAAKKEEFQNAVAYLVRRLDENTAPENFLKVSFDLKPGDAAWAREKEKFLTSLEESSTIGSYARRMQDRQHIIKSPRCCRFENEPDTDFSLPANRTWAKNLIEKWQNLKIETIPLVIGGKEREGKKSEGLDPGDPRQPRFEYFLANATDCEDTLEAARLSFDTFKLWPASKRIQLLSQVAEKLRSKRGDLIGVMMANGGKTLSEADVEVSEAIDFAEYYAKNLNDLHLLTDLSLKGKGPVLVLPPWNFPCAIPAGGCLGALAAGCTVILKPPQETVWVAYELAKIFWEAGVPKDVLQFIVCEDEPEGSLLVKDARVKAILLTGSTATALKLSSLQNQFDLMAETGGKNSLIVSSLSDRDLAVKDAIQSAFGHAGQKCSACSLLILFKEVYEDPQFKKQLFDAASSLKVGSQWNLETKVNPLITEPSSHLLKAMTELEPGEEWVIRPVQDAKNPNLYSPGIKWGVKEGSFTHQTEFFGPLLGVMCANDLEEAIRFANGTPYGLTSGIHSLDEREVAAWEKGISAGNLYVNRGITGAIVKRQPFGGMKESQVGPGVKAGGPNYLIRLMDIKAHTLPPNREPFPLQYTYKAADEELFKASLESYTFFWNHYFSKRNDHCKLVGQDNYFYYVPFEKVYLRVQLGDVPDDIERVNHACKLTNTLLEISDEKNESDEEFLVKLSKNSHRPRVRLLKFPSKLLEQGLKKLGVNVHVSPVLANGRIELLNYLREVSISHDYHRYGNLGSREKETRSPLAVSTARDADLISKGCCQNQGGCSCE